MDQHLPTASVPVGGLLTAPLANWLADGAVKSAEASASMKDQLSAGLPLSTALKGVAATKWLVAGAIIGLCLLYRAALPKPIPGIPYNDESVSRLMGDVPIMFGKKKNGGITRSFFPELFSSQKAPLVQFFRGPFMAPVVAIGDYRTAHDLLVRHGNDFSRGYITKGLRRGIAPALGVEATDPAQKAARELVRDLMTPSFLNEVNAPASYFKVLHFVQFWRRKISLADGDVFDAELDLHALIYDVIMAAATNIKQSDTHIGQAMARPAQSPVLLSVDGKPNATLAVFDDVIVDDLLHSLDVLSEVAGRSLTQPFPRLFYFFTNGQARIQKAFRDRDTIITTYITDAVERMRRTGGHDQFSPLSAIDFIVQREARAAAKDGRAPSYYTDNIIQVVFSYLLAGQDTTHSAISFLIKRLTSAQDKQGILRQELHKSFPEALASNRPPTQEEIIKTQLPYLDATVEETLRMHSAAFGVSRMVNKDIEVLGRTIPKGSAIYLAMTGATYTEKGYSLDHGNQHTGSPSATQQDGVSDWGLSPFPADEFHPERWLKECSDTGEVTFNPKAGPMLSFSAGKGSCWGKKLAYLALRLIVSVLVWNFEFDVLPESLVDWSLTEALTVKPKTTRVLLRSACETMKQ